MRDIRHRLQEAPPLSITALPDGSVDRRSAVIDTEGNMLSRETVGREIAADAKTFLTEWQGVEPGGQSVNAARQLHELGAQTTLLGHLDHTIFESLQFHTYSMGDPAEVHVYELANGVAMFAAETTDIQTWTFERVRSVVGPKLETVFDVDAVVWTNWAAFPYGTDALSELATVMSAGTPLIVDPGAVSTRPNRDQRAFLDGLAATDFPGEVILSPNRREADLLVQTLDVDGATREETAMELRQATEADAVVVHDRPAATVATAEGTLDVHTVEDIEPQRHAGAGDRFSGAIAYGRAAGWSWEETLTLGNACATHYLLHGRSGDRAGLRALLTERLELDGD